MPRIVIECKDHQIRQILMKKIIKVVEEIELSYNLPIGTIEIEVVE